MTKAVEYSVNNEGFPVADKEKWFVASRKEKKSTFYKVAKERFRTKIKLSDGDIVIAGATSKNPYLMGNAIIETDLTEKQKKEEYPQPIINLSRNPKKDDIDAFLNPCLDLRDIQQLDEYADYEGLHSCGFSPTTEVIKSILYAINIVAHSKGTWVDKATKYLQEAKSLPPFFFSSEMQSRYYRFEESSEIIFTGFYPGWINEIKALSIWEDDKISGEFDLNSEQEDIVEFYNSVEFYFSGDESFENVIGQSEEFQSFFNELVFRSALSLLIRGGCSNLLKAALSLDLPISKFYDKLVNFAKEIGSNQCLEILENRNMSANSVNQVTSEARIGDKSDFEINGDVLVKYNGVDSVVVIPDGIKTISENAFWNNKTMKQVVIPSSVKQIKKYAFASCLALESVQLPATIKTIGKGAFDNCSALGIVEVDSVAQTLLETFSSCSSLRECKIRGKVKRIKGLFVGCKSLETVILPPTLEIIEDFSFGNPKSIYFRSEKIDFSSYWISTSYYNYKSLGLNKDTTYHCISGSEVEAYFLAISARDEYEYNVISDVII